VSANDLRDRLRALEAHTGVRTLLLAASNIDHDLLPPLEDALARIGQVPRLDVVVYLRGGEVEAARRIALALQAATPRLRFLVPHFCASSGTILALAADEILAGPLAMFSPIDPHLAGAGDRPDLPAVLSAEDLRRLPEAIETWFGLAPDDAAAQAQALLAARIAPETLAMFERTVHALEATGDALLARHIPSPDARAAIVRTLLQGYGSHDYAIDSDELRALGLPVTRDPAIEALAWDVTCAVRRTIGPESRASLMEDWHDAAVADVQVVALRRRRRGERTGAWHAHAHADA
jgi:hypothetical protein